jgi:F0F1-type ATP synthase assembly protein I
MKTLELNQMESLDGGTVEGCLVGGMMAAINFAAMGPWGMLGGFALGCGMAQLK